MISTSSRVRRVWVLAVTALVAGGLSLVAAAAPASATTVSVATEAEYRAALTALSSDASGPHVIEVTADILLAGSGDPAYTGAQPLTINGNGQTLDGNNNSRILSYGSASLEVNDLSSVNGVASIGAALSGSGPVTVSNSTFTDNTTPSGAAINTIGPVTVSGSTFTDNTSTGPGAGAIVTVSEATITDSTFTGNSPGAIAAYGLGGGGGAMPPVVVSGSTFTGNTDSGALRVGGNLEITDSTFADNAGGVFTGPSPLVTPPETVTVTGSTFTGNSVGGVASGGAISAGGIMTITDSILSGNSAANGGGAVFSEAQVTVTDSTLSGNTNNGPLGSTGGGAIMGNGPVTVTGSTLSGNVSTTAEGGAIFGPDLDMVTVVTSTLSGNTAHNGGAIRGGSVSVTNSTLTANTASNIGGAIGAWSGIKLVYATVTDNSGVAGANVVSAFGPWTSFGSVIALPQGGGSNCSLAATGTEYNYSDDTSCGFTDTTDTEGGGDPLLEALGDFGGPTQTRPPMVTSPLVDAIPVADCDPIDTTDQRGEPRPDGGGCDIGAVELALPPGPPSAPGPPPWAPGPPPWSPGPPPWARGGPPG